MRPAAVQRKAQPAGTVDLVQRDAAFDVATPATTRIQAGTPGDGSGLHIGRADDPAEADADRFAAGLNHDLEIADTGMLRRSATAAADPLGGTAIDAATTSKIRSASGGSTLPGDVRAAAEARSGRDLSAVRIHDGLESAKISRSLQATAFTSGSHIFLGSDAARPGTAAGNTLLGHELGHVVQQGGGVVGRKIQRRFEGRHDLRPLTGPSAPTVHRLLGLGGGKKNSGAARAGAAPASTNQKAAHKSDAKAAAQEQMMLRRRISSFEITLATLRKHKGARGEAEFSVAYSLNAAAERELFALTGGAGKHGKVVGAQNNDDRKRLQRVVDESQMIYDEFRVARTRQRAGEIYHAAGTKDQRKGKGDGFQHQASGIVEFDTPGSQSTVKNQHTGESAADVSLRLQQAGTALGLSKAEIAAIATFTNDDYRYINPATANSMDWMQAANRAIDDDKQLQSMKSEGSLHAGMAMQGLNKMPVWTGTTYRGEKLKPDELAKYFDIKSDGTIKIKQKSFSRQAISSTSKELQKARDFFTVGAPLVPGGKFVIWENEIINGRDIEELSVNKQEKEVATLPGAEFKILSARPDGIFIRAKVRQVK